MAGRKQTSSERRRAKRAIRQRNLAKEIERLRSAVVASSDARSDAARAPSEPDHQPPVECWGHWVSPLEMPAFVRGLRGAGVDYLVVGCPQTNGYHLLTGSRICRDRACKVDHRAVAREAFLCVLEGLQQGRLRADGIRTSPGWASLPEWLCERAGVSPRG